MTTIQMWLLAAAVMFVLSIVFGLIAIPCFFRGPEKVGPVFVVLAIMSDLAMWVSLAGAAFVAAGKIG